MHMRLVSVYEAGQCIRGWSVHVRLVSAYEAGQLPVIWVARNDGHSFTIAVELVDRKYFKPIRNEYIH